MRLQTFLGQQCTRPIMGLCHVPWVPWMYQTRLIPLAHKILLTMVWGRTFIHKVDEVLGSFFDNSLGRTLHININHVVVDQCQIHTNLCSRHPKTPLAYLSHMHNSHTSKTTPSINFVYTSCSVSQLSVCRADRTLQEQTG